MSVLAQTATFPSGSRKFIGGSLQNLALPLNLSISIPLPPNDAKYTASGRQMGYTETALQRYARVEFLRHQKQRRTSSPTSDAEEIPMTSTRTIPSRSASEGRVGEWLKAQLGRRAWQWDVELEPKPHPPPQPIHTTTRRIRGHARTSSSPSITTPLPFSLPRASFAQPQMWPSMPSSSRKPTRSSPLARPPSHKVEFETQTQYAIPTEELDIMEEYIPHGYREPYIFYSSASTSSKSFDIPSDSVTIVSPPRGPIRAHQSPKRSAPVHPPKADVHDSSDLHIKMDGSSGLRRAAAVKYKQYTHTRQAASFGGSRSGNMVPQQVEGQRHGRSKSWGAASPPSPLLGDIQEELEEI